MKKVFIGVGHGGTDPGAVGNGLREKDVNQEIALAMKAELEKNGVIVGISRLKDENDDIAEEIREANAFKPDLAIDVHTNAGGGKGFEALIQTNGYAASSKKLAECIEKEVKALGQVSRGLKTRKNEQGNDYFGFLRQVKAPAIITECAFVDGDFQKIDTKEERVAFGQAYARGVLAYLGIAAVKPAEKNDKVKLIVDEASKIYTIQVQAVNIEGRNYIQLRDLEQIPSIQVDYDEAKKLPILRVNK